MGPLSRSTGRPSRVLRWLPAAVLLAAIMAADTPALARTDDRIASQSTPADSDADGIADQAETTGFSTLNGRFTTDPHKGDTDGDGLTDGDEAGPLGVDPYRSAAYAGWSDPTKLDTDGDGLDDAAEREGESNPRAKDSDGDGLEDFDEIEFGSDPLAKNADGDHLDDAQELREGGDPNVYDLTGKQAAGAFAGAVGAGGWEWGAKHVVRLNDQQLASWQYLTGSVARGFVPFADLTDVAASLTKGEWAAVLVSLVALIPVLGDSAKLADAARKLAAKGGAAAQAALQFIARNPVLSGDAKDSLTRWLVRLDPAKARLAQDAAARGPAPAPLPLSRPIGKDLTQNALKDKKIAELQEQGYTDIRVNQQQVTAAGQRVGINRPDIQATAPDGTRHYFELDTTSSNRGPAHQTRILSNDDTANVCLLSEKDIYQKCA